VSRRSLVDSAILVTATYSLPVVVGMCCGNPKSLVDNAVTP
jgi:hypothetical protein